MSADKPTDPLAFLREAFAPVVTPHPDVAEEDNPDAARIVGKRHEDVGPQGCVVVNMPCEEGFHCPVCDYPQTDPDDGEYDERLAWSEYRTMLWCHVCRRDYPSALCLPGDPVRATAIYLASVESVVAAQPRAAERAETQR